MANQTQHIAPDPRELWWLSFVDPARCAPDDSGEPGGPGFLGVAVVAATSFVDAVREAHHLGCNPGGEVQGHGPFPLDAVPADLVGRLLTKEEIDAFDRAAATPDDDYHRLGVYCGEPAHCTPPRPGALPGEPYNPS